MLELEKKLKNYLENNYNVTVSVKKSVRTTTYVVLFNITKRKLHITYLNVSQAKYGYEAMIYFLTETINRSWVDQLRKD